MLAFENIKRLGLLLFLLFPLTMVSGINGAKAQASEYEQLNFIPLANSLSLSNVQAHAYFLSGLKSRVLGTAGFEDAWRYAYNYFFNELKLNPPPAGYSRLENATQTAFVVNYSEVEVTYPSLSRLNSTRMYLPNGVNHNSMPNGLEGRLVYGGDGTWEAFDGQPVNNSIVLMQIDNNGRWLRAFNLGAKAVIFYETETYTNREALQNFVYIPLYAPRLLVNYQEGVLLRQMLTQGEVHVRLKSKAEWINTEAPTIVAFIYGSDPQLKNDIVILSASYDSYSVTPQEAPGAEESLGISALLEIARYYSLSSPKRSIMFIAYPSSNAIQNIREFVFKHRQDTGKGLGGEGKKFWIDLSLGSGSDYVGTYSQGLAYLYSMAYQQPRMAWVSSWLFSEKGYGKQISDQFNTYRLQSADFVAGGWRNSLPIPYLSSGAEPYIIGGGSGLILATGRDFKTRIYTPLDTISEVNWYNLQKQINVVAAIIHSFVNSTTSFGSVGEWIDVRALVATTGAVGIGTGGLADFYGRASTFDFRTNTYVGVPNTLVQVFLTMPYCNFYTVIKTDSKGNFYVPLVPHLLAHVVHGHNWQWGYVQGVAVRGFVIDDEGNILMAPDKGRYSLPHEYVVKDELTILSPDLRVQETMAPFGTIVFYTGGARPRELGGGLPAPPYQKEAIYGFGQRSSLRGIGYSIEYGMTILDSRAHSIPDYYGSSVATTGGWSVSMVFVQPKVPVEVFIEGTRFLNAGPQYPEGQGFKVDQGECLVLTHTGLRAIEDTFTLDEYRLSLLESRFVRSYRAEEFQNSAREHLQQLLRALTEEGGYKYSVAYDEMRAAGTMTGEAYGSTMVLIMDVINTIVAYFLLILPFSFLFPNLLVEFRSGTKQLAATAITALVSIVTLSFLHPGFAIASNISLSIVGLVVFVLMMPLEFLLFRRCMDYIKQFREKIVGKHTIDIGRITASVSTLSLSLYQMRKRKLRTTLTIVSVVIICVAFVALTSSYAITVYRGSWIPQKTPYNGILISDPTVWWAPFGQTDIEFVKEEFKDAIVVPRSWVYPLGQEGIWEPGSVATYAGAFYLTKSPNVSQTDPEVGRTRLRALTALGPDELRTSSMMLTDGPWFSTEDTYVIILSEDLAKLMNVTICDKVYLNGELELTVKGIVYTGEDWLRKFKDLDGYPIVPRDPMSRPEEQVFMYYDDTAFVPLNLINKIVHRPVGIASIALIFEKADTEYLIEVAKDLVNVWDIRVTVGANDTVATFRREPWFAWQGWQYTIPPFIIGSLVIFNIMLGNIAGRRDEIKTVSTLGLTPTHVLLNFLSESVVIAVTGLVIGYISGIGMTQYLCRTNALPTQFLPNFSSWFVLVFSVLVSVMIILTSLYPARIGSREVTPSLERKWKLSTKPIGDEWGIPLPFQTTMYETGGSMLYLREYIESCQSEGTASYQTSDITYTEKTENGVEVKTLRFKTALPPRDAGILQWTHVIAKQEKGIYNYQIYIERITGASQTWIRSNKIFLNALRQQLLLWRSLTPIERETFIERTRAK